MKSVLHYVLAASTVVPALANNGNNKQITVHDKKFAVSITHDEVAQRVRTLGEQISKDYAGKRPIFVGVLNGAFIFLSDLVRATDLDCEIDFIKIASYGDATTSSGTITLSKGLSCDITDRDVIVVEDIVDSGLSLQFVVDLLKKSNPRSIRVAALLDKNLCKLNFPIDYVGFNIKPEFVIGYGLDYAQAARNLKDIYTLVL